MVTRVEPSADPMAELTSGRVERLIQDARDDVDWMWSTLRPSRCCPTPVCSRRSSMSPSSSSGLAPPSHLVKRAVDILGPKKTLGVVLNAATRPSRQARYGYGYEQGYSAVTAH